MGLLNAVVGGIAGGVAGVGAGLTTISKQWDDRELEAAKQQAEIQKEKRIEEAKGRDRQATLNFNTDPANVAKSAQAKIAGQSEVDKYGDSRFPTELDQKTQEYNATHPYEAEKTLAEIDAQKAHSDYYRSAAAQKYDTLGISDKEERKQYETLLKVLDRKQKNLDALDEKESMKPGSGYASPAERMSMLKEVHDLKNAINGVESGLTGADNGNMTKTSSPQGGDAFGISQHLNTTAPANKEIPKITKSGEENKQREILLSRAQELYPNFDVSGLTDAQLQMKINQATGEKRDFGLGLLTQKTNRFKQVDTGM
ncbi:MAG: hypothetical protein WC856_07675 [Methylococcaceae bacterium]|jgi:hypothetical protein